MTFLRYAYEVELAEPEKHEAADGVVPVAQELAMAERVYSDWQTETD